MNKPPICSSITAITSNKRGLNPSNAADGFTPNLVFKSIALNGAPLGLLTPGASYSGFVAVYNESYIPQYNLKTKNPAVTFTGGALFATQQITNVVFSQPDITNSFIDVPFSFTLSSSSARNVTLYIGGAIQFRDAQSNIYVCTIKETAVGYISELPIEVTSVIPQNPNVNANDSSAIIATIANNTQLNIEVVLSISATDITSSPVTVQLNPSTTTPCTIPFHVVQPLVAPGVTTVKETIALSLVATNPLIEIENTTASITIIDANILIQNNTPMVPQAINQGSIGLFGLTVINNFSSLTTNFNLSATITDNGNNNWTSAFNLHFLPNKSTLDPFSTNNFLFGVDTLQPLLGNAPTGSYTLTISATGVNQGNTIISSQKQITFSVAGSLVITILTTNLSGTSGSVNVTVQNLNSVSFQLNKLFLIIAGVDESEVSGTFPGSIATNATEPYTFTVDSLPAGTLSTQAFAVGYYVDQPNQIAHTFRSPVTPLTVTNNVSGTLTITPATQVNNSFMADYIINTQIYGTRQITSVSLSVGLATIDSSRFVDANNSNQVEVPFIASAHPAGIKTTVDYGNFIGSIILVDCSMFVETPQGVSPIIDSQTVTPGFPNDRIDPHALTHLSFTPIP